MVVVFVAAVLGVLFCVVLVAVGCQGCFGGVVCVYGRAGCLILRALGFRSVWRDCGQVVFEWLVGHCVGCFCLCVYVGGPGYRCVVPVVSCVCWGVAVFIVAHLGVRGVGVWRLGVLLRCVVGVALFGRGVVCRTVPGSQLVGFRRGVLLFLVCVVCRRVFLSVSACALAFSVRGGQGTCAHELYEPPARKQG